MLITITELIEKLSAISGDLISFLSILSGFILLSLTEVNSILQDFNSSKEFDETSGSISKVNSFLKVSLFFNLASVLFIVLLSIIVTTDGELTIEEWIIAGFTVFTLAISFFQAFQTPRIIQEASNMKAKLKRDHLKEQEKDRLLQSHKIDM